MGEMMGEDLGQDITGHRAQAKRLVILSAGRKAACQLVEAGAAQQSAGFAWPVQ
ncbi:hypothetical protein D9M71_727800 [compost metagenome]